MDPGEAMAKLWDEKILQENKSAWLFFTSRLYNFLDESTIDYLIDKQPHLVRMYYIFMLISVTPVALSDSYTYMVNVNDGDYLIHNLECLQKQNSAVQFERKGDFVFLSPLPLIFRIGFFSDSQTYRIPMSLGGSRMAFDIFSEEE